MDVSVDGFIYQQQRFGGVSRIFSQILPRMCKLDPALRITIHTSGRSQQQLPRHPRITHHSLFPVDDLLRPRRLWAPARQPLRQLAQWPSLKGSAESVWHSTYFTRPLRWNGPTVVTVYDMIYELFPDYLHGEDANRFRQQKQRCVLAADKVICISHTTLRDVKAYYGLGDDKLEAIPLAHSSEFRRLETPDLSCDLGNDRPFLLYVGKRGPYKNFTILLEAYCCWPRRREVDLLVVGSDWSAEEQKLLGDWSCKGHVQLLQSVDDRRLASLYNRAHALVYPSIYEGFGIPLLEAMACGCPIVASRIPSTLEVAGELPYYFEAGDVDSLLAALDATLSDEQRAMRAESGIRRAQQYSWGACAVSTLNVYRSLINAR